MERQLGIEKTLRGLNLESGRERHFAVDPALGLMAAGVTLLTAVGLLEVLRRGASSKLPGTPVPPPEKKKPGIE